MADSEDDPLPPVLQASIHDVRYFAAVLRGVSFINRASVQISKRGMTVTVEEARSLVANAFINDTLFDEYEYSDAAFHSSSQPLSSSQEEEGISAAVEIPINTLLECLNIFGSAGSLSSSSSHKKWKRDDDNGDREERDQTRITNFYTSAEGKRTAMRMRWVGSGSPLVLLLAEDANGPTTTCEIATYDPEPTMDLMFDKTKAVLKIILKSSWLRDALSEIDTSCDRVTLIGNPPPTSIVRNAGNTVPIFRIKASGNFGSSEMDYPNDREVLESVECKDPVSFTYRLPHISRALRALQASSKTALRLDKEGLLSMQFQMTSPKLGGGKSEDFVEFLCLAVREDI